jgi:hypothetical protein
VFIFIETLDQYLRHRIEPPKCLQLIRKQYLEIISKEKYDKQAELQTKIGRVLNLWNRRVWGIEGLPVMNYR